MIDTYTITDFKISDFKDQHANTWCEVTFKELGEPIKWVLKDPTKVTIDTQVTGEVVEKTSKAGKPYLRFYKQQENEMPKGDSKEWTDKQDTIRAQWAIGQAVALGQKDIPSLEAMAKELYAMVERVREDKPPEPKRDWSKLGKAEDKDLISEVFGDE